MFLRSTQKKPINRIETADVYPALVNLGSCAGNQTSTKIKIEISCHEHMFKFKGAEF